MTSSNTSPKICSEYRLDRNGDNTQPWNTPFWIWIELVYCASSRTFDLFSNINWLLPLYTFHLLVRFLEYQRWHNEKTHLKKSHFNISWYLGPTYWCSTTSAISLNSSWRTHSLRCRMEPFLDGTNQFIAKARQFLAMSNAVDMSMCSSLLKLSRKPC